MTSTQASAVVTRCGVEVTEEYVENAFQWTRDSGDMEADTVWNAAHAGKKAITLTEADLNGDIKLTCTLTASSATYGSVTVDDNLDASHTPAELDANDIFVIENGDLKVTTSRGNAYVLENSALKAAGARLNGSITAETKLFASQPEDIVEFSYNHNGLRTQKKVTKADGTVETTDYTLHGKLVMHLTKGSDELHFFYDAQSRPAMVEFNGTLYSYIHNLQGDVVGIVDSAGDLVVEYKYDAWGKPVAVRTLTTAYAALAELNPFRYRGYVYDEETDLYYLRSRYYSPQMNRFGNCDSVLTFNSAINILNTFSYCCNCASNMSDHSGTMSEWEILGFAYDGSAGDFRRLEQGLPPQAYENWLKSGGTRNINLVVRDDELVKRTITSITYYPAEIAHEISYDMMSQLTDSSLFASLGDIALGVLTSMLPSSTAVKVIEVAGSLIKLFDSERYKAEVRWFRSAHEIDEDTLSGVLVVTTDSIYYDTGTIIENFREYYSWNGSGNPFANPVPPTPVFQDFF